eukprot:SAG22_NODE_1576_length_4074_cov_3.474717_2_plen_360_part_00
MRLARSTAARAMGTKLAHTQQLAAGARAMSTQYGGGKLEYGYHPDGTPKIGNDLDRIGTHQFCDKTMAKWVTPETFSAFMSKRLDGRDMTKDEANEIADALLRWSTELGAVSFSHIFYPCRATAHAIGGSAGMKHDAFVELNYGSKDRLKPITVEFAGSRLFTGETDGSSFPNGGLRQTNAAAGFTSWDRTSPPWTYRGVLYIPCVLVSHLGHALDEKTPLLRSSDSIDYWSCELLKLTEFEAESERVTINMGCEQGAPAGRPARARALAAGVRGDVSLGVCGAGFSRWLGTAAVQAAAAAAAALWLVAGRWSLAAGRWPLVAGRWGDLCRPPCSVALCPRAALCCADPSVHACRVLRD